MRAEFAHLPSHKNATQKDSSLTELGPLNKTEVLQITSTGAPHVET